MDPLTAMAVSGGAGVLGSYLGNQASRSNADHAFNQQLNASNTAHQREVKDLREAGLNPILSALGNGASTPSAQPSQSEGLGTGIQTGINTGMAVKTMNKDLALKDANIDNTTADTENKDAQGMLLKSQANNSNVDAKLKYIQSDLIEKTLPSMIKKAKAEGDYSEINQIMGVMNSGASSASHLMELGAPLMKAIKGLSGSKQFKLPGFK